MDCTQTLMVVSAMLAFGALGVLSLRSLLSAFCEPQSPAAHRTADAKSV